MKARGNRNEMVIATKYTTGWQAYKKRSIIQSNFGGMNAKNLRHSLDASLTKLQTDFIDILYVHWWDYSADIPEVMHYLNDVVQQGKVIYLGISDTPAWIVAKANEYARGHHLKPFVLYQGKWSASTRDFEREILPMCRAEGMGIAPWGAIGGGAYKTVSWISGRMLSLLTWGRRKSARKILAGHKSSSWGKMS
jgi:aryl-alcohol dehydrogenase-like predicted oxidoreductase